jgi:hypothetical protein
VNWRTDLYFFAGAVLAGVGLWWAYPPAALIGVGLVLMMLGVLCLRFPASPGAGAAPSAPAEPNPPGSEG